MWAIYEVHWKRVITNSKIQLLQIDHLQLMTRWFTKPSGIAMIITLLISAKEEILWSDENLAFQRDSLLIYQLE